MPKPPPAPAPALVRVRLPESTHLLRVGAYLPGQIVEVPAEEAERLIAVKGCERVPTTPIPAEESLP